MDGQEEIVINIRRCTIIRGGKRVDGFKAYFGSGTSSAGTTCANDQELIAHMRAKAERYFPGRPVVVRYLERTPASDLRTTGGGK